jgi:putative transcriptional regulator
MTLCNNIRKLRFEHDEMTQAELAKAVGVSRQTIISVEKNRYTPSVLLALKIARFFDTPLEHCFFLRQDSNDY